jgi:hypothetical protein
MKSSAAFTGVFPIAPTPFVSGGDIDWGSFEKLLGHYHEALHEDGAVKVSLQAYIAAGGWVGIQYSYELDGFEVAGSQVPRRV